MKRIVFFLTLSVAAASSHRLAAQQLSAEYTTEMQTDFRRAANWVNLLRADFTLAASERFHFDLATISIARTRDERLIDDWQTFSNIEEENLPLSLAVAGIRWQGEAHMLFVGIRNMNEDYFVSPVTSLFTNSSCGIFPTISANAPIANYPLSSFGIHYAFETEHWQFQTTLYNGTGHNRFAGRQNVFRICPASDGIFGIASLNYRNNGSNFNIGTTFFSGIAPETEKAEKMTNVALWAYAELRILPSLYALLQYSASPSREAACNMYAGAGFQIRCRKAELGLVSNCARFAIGDEWATEATVKIPLARTCYLQPALHCIRSDGSWKCAGMLRFGCGL